VKDFWAEEEEDAQKRIVREKDKEAQEKKLADVEAKNQAA